MSAEPKGFNVSAVPFQPRARAASSTSSSNQPASATDKMTAPQEQQPKVESYSERAKKAVEKERRENASKQQQQPQVPTPKEQQQSNPNSNSKSTKKGANNTSRPGSGNKTVDSPALKPALVKSESGHHSGDNMNKKGETPEKKKSEKHVTIRVRYARDKLKEIKASTWKTQLEEVQHEERVDHPPFSNIPKSYAKFFECRAHLDWINWESPLMKVPASRRSIEKSFGRGGTNSIATLLLADEDGAMMNLPAASQQAEHQQSTFSRQSSGRSTGSGDNGNRAWGISPGLKAAAATNSPFYGPRSGMSTPTDGPAQFSFHCTVCASQDGSCCEMIGNLIHAVKRKEKTHDHGFLTQSGDVVLGSIRILLAFEHRATSRRMKVLSEKFPKVKNLVKAYLCGEGFHIPPPPVQDEEVWSRFLGRLKFDYIRDNRTKVFTELSKHWKRSHTKFEQFAHFASFRDAVPYFPTIGMITNTQKPFLVSCSTGDIEATVHLGELGFTVMADVFWDMLPYYEELPNHVYAVLRHLCVYYFKKQQRRMMTQANQYHAQVAPSPALPPMRSGAGVSPILAGADGGAPPPPIPGLASQ